MNHFQRIFFFVIVFLVSVNSVFSLEKSDRNEIQEVIKNYTDSWNLRGGKGFGDGYTQDADFVNIFGMVFSGKAEIEERHIQILRTFLEGSNLEIVDSQLREAQPGLVIALVRWKLTGYRAPGSTANKTPEGREGIYTHVFIKSDKKWKIAASQNTLVAINKTL